MRNKPNARRGGRGRPFRKGDPRAGRPKGTPNKTTAVMRQAFLEAFDQLGGVPALVHWGRKQPTEFYRLAARLIPIEPEAGRGRTLEEILEASWTDEERARWTKTEVKGDGTSLAVTVTSATRPPPSTDAPAGETDAQNEAPRQRPQFPYSGRSR